MPWECPRTAQHGEGICLWRKCHFDEAVSENFRRGSMGHKSPSLQLERHCKGLSGVASVTFCTFFPFAGAGRLRTLHQFFDTEVSDSISNQRYAIWPVYLLAGPQMLTAISPIPPRSSRASTYPPPESSYQELSFLVPLSVASISGLATELAPYPTDGI